MKISAILVLTLTVFIVVLTEVNAAAGPVKFLKRQNATTTTEPPASEDAVKGNADDLKGKSVLDLKRHKEGAGIIEEGNADEELLHGKSLIGLKKHKEGVAKIESKDDDSKDKNVDSKDKNVESKDKNVDSKDKNVDSKDKNVHQHHHHHHHKHEKGDKEKA